MDEDEPDIEKNIRKWLEREGYPCEMRTARAFRKQGFGVSQSYHYESQDGETIREGDVHAALVHDVIRESPRLSGRVRSSRAIASLEMGVVCECKTTSKPWVMFTRALEDHERHARLERVSTEGGQDLITEAFPMLDASQKFALYRDPIRAGYHLKCSHDGPGKRKDVAYEAGMQVADATLAALDESMSRWAPRWRPCRFVIPLIVLRGPLFECFLDEHGSVQLHEATLLSLYWGRPFADGRTMVVDVVTLDALADYIDAVASAFEHLRDSHEGAIVTACEPGRE